MHIKSYEIRRGRYSPLMGDVLNLISIKDRSTRELFKKVFSPVHLIIDPNNGRFNNNLNLERDQILGINSLLE